jgi:hypothetical protein
LKAESGANLNGTTQLPPPGARLHYDMRW